MRLSIIFFSIILLLVNISCSKSQKETIINGNISNLPDGTMYLANLEGDRIDSAKTIKGVFTITHKWNEKEPKYIKLNHVDKKGILRFFAFTTNAKYKGFAGWKTEAFLSDSIITIDGNLKYDTYVGIQLPPDRKPVTGPPLEAGKQTEAFYNIDGDLFEKIEPKTFNIVKEKIKKYPFSYHLLYKIDENKNSFTAKQVDDFLKFFKGEITQSESYKKLYAYNQKRFNEKNIAVPLLNDNNNVKKEIIDKKYQKHLVVFWASWCGPCRKEIPFLKKMNKKYGSQVEFVSISTDDDQNAWQKALKSESMEWKQLIVGNDMDKEALQIHFKLNSAIPYTVLVDNDLKILSSSLGLSNESELDKLLSK